MAEGDTPAAAGTLEQLMVPYLVQQVAPKAKKTTLQISSNEVKMFTRKQMQGLHAENCRALLMEKSKKPKVNGSKDNIVKMVSIPESSYGFFTVPIKILAENKLI